MAGIPSRRAHRIVAAGSTVLALGLSTAVVWRTAYATFTTSTSGPATTLVTGSLALSDDDAGSALFSVSGLKPAAAGTRCIAVTSTGNVPSAVRLYASARSGTRSLSSYLTLSVQIGTGGSTASCAGFAPASTVYRGPLASFPTSYGSAAAAWTTAGRSTGESRTYQITYSLAAGAPTSAQGGTATVTLTWEAQST